MLDYLRLFYRRRGLLVAAVLAVIAVFAFLAKSIDGKDDYELKTVASEYRTIEVNGYRFNMVKVEGGRFTMGATSEQGDDFDSDERPVMDVTLSDFYIGETEVTQGLWYAVMGTRPMKADGDNHPMKEVSYDDCTAFVDSLSRLTGLPFHLPTEAQWEYAARGGRRTGGYIFAGSNDIEEVAWYSANSWDNGKGNPGFGNHAVGTKAPNELGLYDMSGNVWEWCLDIYDRYDGQEKTDPTGPGRVEGAYRVNRGGSWDYIATSARVSNRRNRTRDFRNFNLGLRVAL